MLCKIKRLLALAWRIARERRVTLAGLALVAAAGCVLILPHDQAWHQQIATDEQPWHSIAQQLSRWGDYWTGTLIITAALWLAGAAFHRPRWRTAALACLLGATLAGIEVNIVRFATGRPRPRANQPDGFYGPRFGDYCSFPSAHTTSAFATAGSLAVALPPVGVPLLLGAGSVGWSRMCLSQHYPSDVWAGMWLGSLNGVVLGFAARRWRREDACGASSVKRGT